MELVQNGLLEMRKVMCENQSFFEKHKEIILYTVAGVSAVVVNWLLYSIFVAFMPLVVANTLSWGLTVIFAFITNKLYVFQSRCFEPTVLKKEILTFITSRGITGFLEVVAQPQLYALGMDRPLFGVDGLEAKITVCVILSIVNYLSTKLLVFRVSGGKEMELS